MNAYQVTLLGKIIDINWDIETTRVSGASRDAMTTRLQELTNELAEQMGEEAYNEFMLKGHEMLASV